ncbi:uncharacterized protein [Mytilus edulis]|uniref:uncharacterized protein n=1 Tax=Mytilus edulis TaxID=6550 RepID=UPI0039EE1037
MSSFTPSCDICDNLYMTKPAIAWCSECDEFICDDCERKHGIQKATRHHNTTSIDDYQKLPSSVSNISQECNDHHKKLNFYCATHNEPCCVSCISAEHTNCRELKELSEIVKGVKYSSEFVDLKERVKYVSQLFEKLIRSKMDHRVNLKNMKQAIDCEIDRVRKAINDNLDKLQNQFSALVADEELQQRDKIDSFIGELVAMKYSADEISNDLQKTEKHASEFQTFLHIKYWSKEIEKLETYLKTTHRGQTVGSVRMYMELCPILKDIEHNVTEFGKVKVKIKKTSEIVLQKEKQGQTLVPVQGVTNINLTKIRSFKLSMDERESISGCDMLEDERILVSVCSKFPRLVVISPHYSHMKIIPLSGYPADIVIINNHTAAVTLYQKKEIVIVDIDSSKIINTILIKDRCYGITCTAEKLVIGLEPQIIQTMDRYGNILSKITTTSTKTYCTICKNKLYYVGLNDNAVYSCNLNGDVLWKVNCNELVRPNGLTNDSIGNIFVTCEKNNKVIMIESSGNKYRVVLTDQDELHKPGAIHYDIKSDVLMVCNKTDLLFLYKVTHNMNL